MSAGSEHAVFPRDMRVCGLPGNVHVAMQLWDIGGQTIGNKMIQKYIFGAQVCCSLQHTGSPCNRFTATPQAILCVYDVTSYESFQNLQDWMRLVKLTHAKDSMPMCALVGNKTDLNHMQTTSKNSPRVI